MSGTIKKAEEEAIRRARLSIRRAQNVSSKSDTATGSTAAATVPSLENDADDGVGLANGIEDLDEPDDMDEDSD